MNLWQIVAGQRTFGIACLLFAQLVPTKNRPTLNWYPVLSFWNRTLPIFDRVAALEINPFTSWFVHYPDLSSFPLLKESKSYIKTIKTSVWQNVLLFLLKLPLVIPMHTVCLFCRISYQMSSVCLQNAVTVFFKQSEENWNAEIKINGCQEKYLKISKWPCVQKLRVNAVCMHACTVNLYAIDISYFISFIVHPFSMPNCLKSFKIVLKMVQLWR